MQSKRDICWLEFHEISHFLEISLILHLVNILLWLRFWDTVKKTKVEDWRLCWGSPFYKFVTKNASESGNLHFKFKMTSLNLMNFIQYKELPPELVEWSQCKIKDFFHSLSRLFLSVYKWCRKKDVTKLLNFTLFQLCRNWISRKTNQL